MVGVAPQRFTSNLNKNTYENRKEGINAWPERTEKERLVEIGDEIRIMGKSKILNDTKSWFLKTITETRLANLLFEKWQTQIGNFPHEF